MVLQPLFLLPALMVFSQTVSEVGCGEYGRYLLRADNGQVYEDYWNGHSVSLTAVNTNGKRIIDISGALYTAVGIDESGYPWVFSQGSIAPLRITTDVNGAPFDRNISCAGYFGTYATLRKDGSIWIWGKDAWGLFSKDGTADIPKPVPLKMPPGIKFKKIRAGNRLIALASNGAVYEYAGAGGVPARVLLPRPATDIAASHMGFYIAIVPDGSASPKAGTAGSSSHKDGSMGYPYGWGAESVYFGSSGNILVPIPLKKGWGLTVPIKRITTSHNTIHFIDSLGRLYGMGDNAIGEVGNGTELVNHAERYPTPYAWSWNKHEQMVSKPVRIGNEDTRWKDIWAGNSYAFYHYAIDENDSLYFWGRSKSWVSGKGHNNEDKFPNAFDILSPAMIHPFTTPNMFYGDFIRYRVDAGQDQSVSEDMTRLTGTAIPSTGYTISSIQWTKISGPPCIIDSPASASTTVSGLVPGIYLFRLQMTDNNTATISDTVAVHVTRQ